MNSFNISRLKHACAILSFLFISSFGYSTSLSESKASNDPTNPQITDYESPPLNPSDNREPPYFINEYLWLYGLVNFGACTSERIVIFDVNHEIYLSVETSEDRYVYDNLGAMVCDLEEKYDCLDEGIKRDSIISVWVCGITSNPDIDYDFDGYSASEGDCDDYDGKIYPYAPEIPNNGKDDDCIGGDFKSIETNFLDEDEDGYYAGVTDCDDNNPNIHPGAEDKLQNDIDEDCSGSAADDNNRPLCEINIKVEGNTIMADDLFRTRQNKIFLFDGLTNVLLDSSCTYLNTCLEPCLSLPCPSVKLFNNLHSGEYRILVQSFNQSWSRILCSDNLLTKVTIHDDLTSDICNNEKIAINTIKNLDNTYQINFATLGLAPNIVIDLFTENYEPVFNYFGSSKSIPLHDTLLIGKYNLKIKFYDYSWNLICGRSGMLNFSQQGEQTVQYRQNSHFQLTGFLNNANIQLQWATTNSKVKKQFTIEKSTDGQNFTYLQSVTAVDNKETYIGLDHFPINGVNFYRVLTEFEDGHIAYSETIPVNWQPTGKLHLFPNPATDYVYLTLEEYLDSEVDIVITNQIGKLVYQQHIDKVLNPDRKINTVNFQDGLHIITVINKGRAISEKFIHVKLK